MSFHNTKSPDAASEELPWGKPALSCWLSASCGLLCLPFPQELISQHCLPVSTEIPRCSEQLRSLRVVRGPALCHQSCVCLELKTQSCSQKLPTHTCIVPGPLDNQPGRVAFLGSLMSRDPLPTQGWSRKLCTPFHLILSLPRAAPPPHTLAHPTRPGLPH